MEAFTLRPVISGQGRLSPFLPAENRCLFNFHPAGTTHAQKTDSARKPGKRKTAVAGGGLQRRKLRMFWSFTVREGRAVYFQSGGLEAGKTAVLFFMPEHGLRPGWTAVQYDVTSDPQIVMTLQGPSDGALVKYLAENRENLVYALEKAERDRAVKANETYGNPGIESAILKTFGVEMKVPKGYTLAAQKPDFIWARNEYPTASQGFFIYSYPYEGKQSLTEEALVAARNKYAAQIPGPAEGSYMITSDAFAPDYRLFRMEGRLWCELRGFWDVHGDFMGGPFVSYTTVDTATNRVFTLDCYVYAPDLNKPRKRNYMRGLEHLLYSVRFPRQ